MATLPDRLALNRLDDLAEQARRRDYPAMTSFLTPVEQTDAMAYLSNQKIRHVHSGGFVGAERQILILLPPDWPDESVEWTPSLIAGTITALCIRPALRRGQTGEVRVLTHRDYLGSLLGLGIRRDQIGDILVDDNQAIALVLETIVPLIRMELRQVGALSVQIEPVGLDTIRSVQPDFALIRISAASMRFDKIASAGFNVARSTMADWIRSGQVQLNWKVEQRPDHLLEIGDVISLRGHGRIRIQTEQGKSKKDRHILLLERY